MSLESCIKKAGPDLTKEDAAAIRVIRDDIVKGGGVRAESEMTPNEQAVAEYLDILDIERDFIMTQVEAVGGTLADPNLSASEFAQKAAANLEAAARKFPRKGIMRPATETRVIDAKTGESIYDEPGTTVGDANIKAARRNMAGDIVRMNDPQQRVIDLVTERTYRTVEHLFPDFYTLPPDQVLAIVAQFDEKAALGLAKHFGILPQSARKLIPENYNVFRMKQIQKNASDITNEADWFYGWSGEVVADWITKNETLPLYFKVDDIFERDFADKNPDSPLAITTRYGQVLLEAEETKAVGIRRLMNWVIDKGEVTKEWALGAVPQTKLKDFIKFGLIHVERYTNLVKQMDAWMSNVIEGDGELAKRWMTFNQKQGRKNARLLSEFATASSLAGVDVPTFQMPDAATYTKMNMEDRAKWQERQVNYNKLKKFWFKDLAGMGEKTTYQKRVYNTTTDKFDLTGESIQVSEGQYIYLSARDSYANQRKMLIHNLNERIQQTDASQEAKSLLIAKLRKQFEAGLIVPYFPLQRFGKYHAVARKKNVDGVEGEIVAYIKKETRRERNQWMNTMREKGLMVTPIEEQASDLDQMNKIDPGFVASVTELLTDTTVVDTDGNSIPGTSVADDIWQMYLKTLPDMSARKQYIHRKGRAGFSHDALRTFSDHSFHGTHQAAKLKFGHDLNEGLRLIQENSVILSKRVENIRNWQDGDRPIGLEDATLHEVLQARIIDYDILYGKAQSDRGESAGIFNQESHEAVMAKIIQEAEHDGPWAVPMANEMVRRHNYNMNPKSAPWSTKLTALGFLWFLSTSPAAGILNLTQTPIVAYPILRARFSGQGAGMALLKATKEYATAPTLEKITSKLRGDERLAIQEFEIRGMYSKTRTRELLGFSESRSVYSGRQEQFLSMTGWIFHKSEEMNRVVTSLAAYRLARKSGESHSLAIETADKMVEMSHFDYTNTNRPRFMQGDKGRVVFLFRNYSLNMTYRLMRDFKDGPYAMMKNDPNVRAEDRVAALRRLTGILGMTFLFAGAGAWPLMSALQVIVNNMFGDEDDPFDSKTELRTLVYDSVEEHFGEVWGQRIATGIMKGPWSVLTGADLSQRASLNNLWVRDIPENLKEKPRDLLLHLSGEALGPIFGMGLNFAGGIGDFQDNRTRRGIEKFMPKGISDILKTIRYAQEGAQTYQRDMILSPEEFTSADLTAQALGFTPTALSDRYEQNRAIKDLEQKLRNRRSDLMNQLFMAWRLGDRAAARETMQAIAKWNRTNPRYPISPDSIRQSGRTRAAYDMRTVGGVAVDKRLQYLIEQHRFIARPAR